MPAGAPKKPQSANHVTFMLNSPTNAASPRFAVRRVIHIQSAEKPTKVAHRIRDQRRPIKPVAFDGHDSANALAIELRHTRPWSGARLFSGSFSLAIADGDRSSFFGLADAQRGRSPSPRSGDPIVRIVPGDV
jgi:hypothetical protein